jgi:hypothetical protein
MACSREIGNLRGADVKFLLTQFNQLYEFRHGVRAEQGKHQR